MNIALFNVDRFNLGSKKYQAVLSGQERSKRYHLGRFASLTEAFQGAKFRRVRQLLMFRKEILLKLHV